MILGIMWITQDILNNFNSLAFILSPLFPLRKGPNKNIYSYIGLYLVDIIRVIHGLALSYARPKANAPSSP